MLRQPSMPLRVSLTPAPNDTVSNNSANDNSSSAPLMGGKLDRQDSRRSGNFSGFQSSDTATVTEDGVQLRRKRREDQSFHGHRASSIKGNNPILITTSKGKNQTSEAEKEQLLLRRRSKRASRREMEIRVDEPKDEQAEEGEAEEDEEQEDEYCDVYYPEPTKNLNSTLTLREERINKENLFRTRYMSKMHKRFYFITMPEEIVKAPQAVKVRLSTGEVLFSFNDLEDEEDSNSAEALMTARKNALKQQADEKSCSDTKDEPSAVQETTPTPSTSNEEPEKPKPKKQKVDTFWKAVHALNARNRARRLGFQQPLPESYLIMDNLEDGQDGAN